MSIGVEITFKTTNSEEYLKRTLQNLEQNEEVYFWVYTFLGNEIHVYCDVDNKGNLKKSFDKSKFIQPFLQEKDVKVSEPEFIKFEKWYRNTALAKGMGIMNKPGFYSHKGFVSSVNEVLDQMEILGIDQNKVPEYLNGYLN